MPHVVLERDGLRIEAELSLDELKDLIGVKASPPNQRPSATAPPPPKPEEKPVKLVTAYLDSSILHGYKPFLDAVSDRGRQFIDTLKSNPDGIEASDLAALLSLDSAAQIGGITGGGLAKLAKRFQVELKRVYRTEVTKVKGQRVLKFYPGELLLKGG
jgi:hypothetical protein